MAKTIKQKWTETSNNLSFEAQLKLDADEYVNLMEFQKRVEEYTDELHQSLSKVKEGYLSGFLNSRFPKELFNEVEIYEALQKENYVLCEQQLAENKYKFWIAKDGEQIYPELTVVFEPMETR